jgi:uncharacterized protein (DUF302 family)
MISRLACMIVLAVTLHGAAQAENMLMSRVPLAADIVLAYAQSSIEEHGYSIAHIQTCDDGLGDFGYKSDFYRVLFFGKAAEVRQISAEYPELVSYLPLKLAIIAERDETLLSILNPEALAPFFADQAVQIQLGRWHNDLVSILDDVVRSTAARVALPKANSGAETAER